MRTDAETLERRVRELELFVEVLARLLPLALVAVEAARREAAHESGR